MREMQELSAEAREGTGKGPAYQARLKGFVPGIIYGGKDKPEPIAIERLALERHTGRASFLTTPYLLAVGTSKTRVIPRAVQMDPVTDRPVHVDFMRLPEGAKIKLAIPVRFRGQESSPGIKRGGVLNIVRHEIELLCPAEHIPEFIDADLSGLDIRDSVHITSVKLPEGVVPLVRERDFTIASIVAPTSVIEEQRAAAAAAASAASAPAAEEGAAAAEGAAPAGGAGAAAGAKAGAKPAAKAPEKK
ncbi:MAG TPA: 50S ribosomal protein L25/general stress protein Ctc [Acidisoma sp.]|jgi:large subunit ribosomal protein L25|nr:50S ribosomal protein L25/general stress protein Ctc [Acidisoma sp.]